MKILLVNVPIFFNKWQNLEMPLGVAYMASELERRGHSVKINDYEVESFNSFDFSANLRKLAPDVVGISFRSSSYTSAKVIAGLVKKSGMNIPVVLGGHHASAFPEDTLRQMDADFVIQGEGECALPELMDAISGKIAFEQVGRLFQKKADSVISQGSNLHSRQVEDLDGLAFPAWHLLPIDRYVTGSILTSRGCPFACIYCDKSVSKRQVKFRSPQNIYHEISEFEGRYKKGRIYFVDDYFFLQKKRLLELCKLMIEDRSLHVKWYCQARVDGVDADSLDAARKSGCRMIIYGVETGDDSELEYINKRADLNAAYNAMDLTRRSGIQARANFMIGFPISTHKTISNSIRFARKINADLYRFFIVSPLPNTILWDRLEKTYPGLFGIGWEKFDFYTPSFDTIEIKKEDLVTYVLAAYFYVLRPKLIRELTIGFFPALAKLIRSFIKSGRLRGNLSLAFPVCVNFFLEEWFILQRFNFRLRLRYIRKMIILSRQIKSEE